MTADAAAPAPAANRAPRPADPPILTGSGQILATLEKLGVPQKNIQTTSFFVTPQYTNGDNNNPRRLTGYQVSNEVSVRLEDVAKLGGAASPRYAGRPEYASTAAGLMKQHLAELAQFLNQALTL